MQEPAADAIDADLVGRAAAGDRDAFASLYSRHQASVYRFTVHMTGSPAAAEDIVQEGFVALMGGLGRYNPARPLPGYLIWHRPERDPPPAPARAAGDVSSTKPASRAPGT